MKMLQGLILSLPAKEKEKRRPIIPEKKWKKNSRPIVLGKNYFTIGGLCSNQTDHLDYQNKVLLENVSYN